MHILCIFSKMQSEQNDENKKKMGLGHPFHTRKCWWDYITLRGARANGSRSTRVWNGDYRRRKALLTHPRRGLSPLQSLGTIASPQSRTQNNDLPIIG